MRALEFNKIYVIESLFPADKKTGEILYNDIIKRKIEQNNLATSHEFLVVSNRDEFFIILETVRQEVIHKLVNPILHFEIHGCTQGFVLNSDELIEWSELQMKLIEINVLTKNNLFLSLATCYGAYIHKVISPKLWAPFWGYVGPLDETYEEDVMVGFQSFYDEFFTSFDFNKSTIRLNQSNPDLPTQFYFCNAEYIFRKSYDKYERTHLTDEALARRLEEGLKEARKNQEVSHLSEGQIKEILRYWIVDKKDFLKESMMDHFLMYDLFPELRN